MLGEKNQYLKPEKEEDGDKKILTLTYFAPGPRNVLKADRPCWVFHFVNFEKIVELVNSGAAEREKSRSMSFTSFRKTSSSRTAAAAIKITRADHDEEAGERVSPAPHSFSKKQLETIDENDT